MKKIGITLATVVVGLSLGIVSQAHASYISFLYQDGSNVAAVGSGSVDTSGLFLFRNVAAQSFVHPKYAGIGVGSSAYASVYFLIKSSSPFGNGGATDASVGTGNFVGIGNFGLVLPTGYSSGASLGTSTATWDSTTLSALGVKDGTYSWSWGTGANADRYTLYVGVKPSSVPEPGSLALLGTGLLGLGLVARRKRRHI